MNLLYLLSLSLALSTGWSWVGPLLRFGFTFPSEVSIGPNLTVWLVVQGDDLPKDDAPGCCLFLDAVGNIRDLNGRQGRGRRIKEFLHAVAGDGPCSLTLGLLEQSETKPSTVWRAVQEISDAAGPNRKMTIYVELGAYFDEDGNVCSIIPFAPETHPEGRRTWQMPRTARPSRPARTGPGAPGQQGRGLTHDNAALRGFGHARSGPWRRASRRVAAPRPD